MKENTVQALVIRTHHTSLDGRQVVSVKKRKRAREPKGSDATAIIARPRSGARILQQDELVAVLQSTHALHIVGDPQGMQHRHEGWTVALVEALQGIHVQTERF